MSPGDLEGGGRWWRCWEPGRISLLCLRAQHSLQFSRRDCSDSPRAWWGRSCWPHPPPSPHYRRKAPRKVSCWSCWGREASPQPSFCVNWDDESCHTTQIYLGHTRLLYNVLIRWRGSSVPKHQSHLTLFAKLCSQRRGKSLDMAGSLVNVLI